MFTFKKFAAIGVAAFTALTISSCSDTDDDEDAVDGNGNTLSIPGGYAHSKVVTLGGTSNSTDGSFLDADGSIEVYKQSAATKDEIDLVFDGTNLFAVSYYDTQAGASALGSSKLKGGETAIIWQYTASDEAPQAIVDFISAKYDAGDEGSPNFAPTAGKKYAVFTTDGIFALVKVDEISTSKLVASVGNFDIE